jgi:hypothetical protein
MLVIYILIALIMTVLGLNVTSGKTVGFELQAGVTTATGLLVFDPYLNAPITSNQTTTNQDSTSTITVTSEASPGDSTITQIVSETIVQTVTVSVTAPL